MTGSLVIAACGGDGESASPDATTAATAAATTAATGGDAQGSDTTVAGQAADDSMDPVVFGFHNLEGGAVSLPEIRIGFEEGVKYVNEELGGINGHPVEIEACNLDVTPESSVNCANQFVEANVAVAVQGVDVAADAALPILKQAGIAEIAFAAFTPGLNHAPGDAFVTLAASEEFLAADMIAQKELGVNHVAVLLLDLPTSHAYMEDVIKPVVEELGMEFSPFFYQTQTDWTSFAAVVLASGADGVSFPSAEEQVCLAAIPAFRSAGFPGTLHASSCAQPIEDLDADVLENVYNHNEFYYATFTEVPPKAQRDIDTFMRYMERDYPQFESLVYTQLGFHVAVVAADMVRQTEGELTAENIKASLPNAKGHTFFRETDYDCSKPLWPGTSACAAGVIYTRVTPDKKKEEMPFSPIDVRPVIPES